MMGKQKNFTPSLGFCLSLILSLFALLPTVLLCFIIYNNNNESYTRLSIENAKNTVSDVSQKLEDLFNLAESTAELLSKDTTLQEAHIAFSSSNIPLSDALDYYSEISKTLKYLNIGGDFYNIRIYLPDHEIITQERYSIFGVSELESSGLPGGIRDESRRYSWSGLHQFTRIADTQKLVSYFYCLFSYRTYSQNNSMIAIDISERTIQNILGLSKDTSSYFAIIDDNGEPVVLSSSLNGKLDSYVADKIDGNLSNQKVSQLFGTPGGAYCYYQKAMLGNTGWSLDSFVPVSLFSENNSGLFSTTVMIIIICLSIIPFIAYLIARRMLHDIKSLTANSAKVQQGRYDCIPEDSYFLEIQTLQQTHNEMIETIDSLIHDIYEERIAKQEAELSFLYEQIKPHFIYNTLESAKWMAIKENAPVVARFVENLSSFFKLTLSKGNNWITLDQEITHIKTYVEIMNARFCNRIELEMHISENIRYVPVLKLILQPIVENSILHGIYEKEELCGTIVIDAKEEDKHILITVSDDGIGMDETKISELNSNASTGLGIENVRKRLVLFYHIDCPIIFRINDKNGITVTLTIPIINKKNLKNL